MNKCLKFHRSSIFDDQIDIFEKYWKCESLLEELLSIESNEKFEKIIDEILADPNKSSDSFTEVLFKIITTIIDDQNSFKIELIKRKFIEQLNENNEFLKCFQNISESHCNCFNIKCFRKILKLIELNNECITSKLDENLIKIFEFNSQAITQRCFAIELLKFSSFIYSMNCISIRNKIENYIRTNLFIDLYMNYFKEAHDFAGNPMKIAQHLTKEDLEFKYDCTLIRCYINLVVNYLSNHDTVQDNYEFLSKHLNLLKYRLEKKNISQLHEDFPVEWTINIYINEDFELFTLFYRILLIFNSNSTTNTTICEHELIIHKLFKHFLTDCIHTDTSVMIDMLFSDQDTATIVLKFLLKYLKILFIHLKDSSKYESIEVIAKTMNALNEKISKMHEKKLLPYNVKPLLNLLNQIK